MNGFRSLLAVASMLVFLATSASADCGKDPECDAPSAWVQFTSMTLSLSQPGTTSSAAYKAVFDHGSNDFLIDVDVRDPKYGMKGTVGMVGGRVMVSKGLTLPRGAEIDAIDGPVLSLRLVSIILGRALPDGPSAVSGTKRIDYEGKAGIQFATPSASGYIPLPWRITGEVRKLPGDAISYDITLMAGSKDKGGVQNSRYKGEFSMRSTPVFDERMTLADWTVYGVGPQVEEQKGGTIYDYGAKPRSDARWKTIADIRAYIAEQNNPGKRDETKDFTGFWKSKCEESFGLSIERRGDDGKYAVVFCGPGGCGAPSDARQTFITGDRHYEVVSEDEFYEIYGSGKKDRMVRCTKDPHPRLDRR